MLGRNLGNALKQPMIDDGNPSSVIFNLTVEVKDVDFPSVSSSHSIIFVGNVGIPIKGTNMRLFTRTRYKEEEGIGVKIKGITQPLEVEQRPLFARLGCTEGQFSKMLEASMTLLKPSRKEDDWNTSPSTYDNMHCRERAKESSCSHDHTRDRKEMYNQSWIVMFILITTIFLIMNENHGIKELVVFVDYITVCLLTA